MSTAWLFPGQGSQTVGMGRDLYDFHPEARALFDTADKVLGFSLTQVCFEGPEEKLRRTAFTQPALLTASLAAVRVLEAGGIPPPAAVAGHSLGEYTALVVAGALPFAAAVKMVHLRGQFMQEAVAEGTGTMAAILGLSDSHVAEICSETAESQVVEPANLNAPGQVVISGHIAAVDRARHLARERGARRAITLNVSTPFHCSLMEPAAQRLATVIQEGMVQDTGLPVWINADAKPLKKGPLLCGALLRQVTAPVRWRESVQGMERCGVTSFLEIGPGGVLAGLARRTVSKACSIQTAGDDRAIQKLLAPGS